MLGHGVGHQFARQNLAVGDAHAGAQPPIVRAAGVHAVRLPDHLRQRDIEEQRVEGQQELPREQVHQGQPELLPGPLHYAQHGRVASMGLLEPAHHVLYEHDGRAHVHEPVVRPPGQRHEAHLRQKGRELGVEVDPAEGIGMLGGEAPRQQLVEHDEQPVHALGETILHGFDVQDAPGGVPAKVLGCAKVAQDAEQIRSGDRPARDPPQALSVAAPENGGGQGPAVVGKVDPEILRPQGMLVLGRVEV